MNIKKLSPLSPHLQIYKFNLSSFTSIFGRFCGIVSFLSIFLLSWGMIIDNFYMNQFIIVIIDATFLSKNYYIFVFSVFVLFCIVFAGFFYFSTMIRHLLWNFNLLVDLKYSKFLSIFCLIFSLLATLFVIISFLFHLSYFKYLISVI